jgi:hypothetical protein
MHPVVNEVPIPTDAIEKELLLYAERKFTGRLELSFRVKPEAALSVEVLPPKAIESQHLGDRQAASAPPLFRQAQPSQRELIVKQLLVQNAYRFRLGMKLTGLICDFKEGTLNATQWVTVG